MSDSENVNITSLGDIHKSWYDGDGPCTECPRRDCDHITAPVYGYGQVPADIAIVAQAPGGSSVKDAAGSMVGDGRRTWQNYRESKSEGAMAHTRDGFELSSIDTVGNYEKDIKPIVEALNQACEKRLDRECNIYYTQHTKCNDIHDTHDFDPKSDDGQDLCARYLIPELKTVEPDVVLVMGGKPNNHLGRSMADLGVKNSTLPDKDKNKIFDNPEDPIQANSYSSDAINARILPSYHYGGRGKGNISQYTGVEDRQEYWKMLAEEASSYFTRG